MVSKTNEQALEAAIQRHLTGLTTESVAEQPAPYHRTLFRLGWPTDFNAEYALDTRLFWEFLETTQGKELAKLKNRNPSDWQRKIPRTLRPADQKKRPTAPAQKRLSRR